MISCLLRNRTLDLPNRIRSDWFLIKPLRPFRKYYQPVKMHSIPHHPDRRHGFNILTTDVKRTIPDSSISKRRTSTVVNKDRRATGQYIVRVDVVDGEVVGNGGADGREEWAVRRVYEVIWDFGLDPATSGGN